MKVRRVQRPETGATPTPRQVRAVSGSGCLLAVVLAVLGLLASLVAVVVLAVSSVLSLASHAVRLLFATEGRGRDGGPPGTSNE